MLALPAHGVGGAQDLPIPAPLAIAGAAAALTVSFLVLAIAWRTPRLEGTAAPRVWPWLARVVDSTGFVVACRGAGLAALAYIGWAAIEGPDLVTNPTFGTVYVLLWVGLVPASVLLGAVWKAVSPARAIYAALDALVGRPAPMAVLPRWVGLWPATLGLLAFVWLELIYDQSTYLAPVRLWFAIYFAILILGAVIFGEEWFARADPFEAYSTLLSNLTPWGRDADGLLTVRAPLDRLCRMQPQPGLLAATSVLLGSTAFDSLSRSSAWFRFIGPRSADAYLYSTLVLLAMCAFVAVTFSLAAMAVPARRAGRRRDLPPLFAASLVPIIVGYMCAHYLSLLVEYGQVAVVQLSDPMVNGSNLLGTANWTVTYPLSTQPSMLADIKVLAVLAGHIVGVIAAHELAVRTLPKRWAVRGQLPMLAVMVLYTSAGLFLLFNG